MGIGSCICLWGTITFGIFTIIFAISGEKGAMLISGFNTLTETQRNQYDKSTMVKDMRNMFLTWTVLMLIGMVFCILISEYIVILVGLIWIILFFKNLKLFPEDAFEKYKINDEKE